MPRPNLARLSLAIILTAALAGLTACAGPQAVTVGKAGKPSATAKPVETGARRLLTTADAQAALPTASEIGTGWVDGKNPSDDSGDDSGSTSATPTFAPAECAFSAENGAVADLAVVPDDAPRAAEATVDFHQPPADDSWGLDAHGVTVRIQSFDRDIDAARLTKISQRLEPCSQFTSTDPTSGVSISWQIIPVSMSNYGDGTLAFRMQGAVSFIVVLLDSVQIVAGHNLVTITQSGIGSVDTGLAARVAQTVMTKLGDEG
ncbi:hypothetical protein GCM10027515_07140 [Schumannella luteola]|uniref:PknH-like extracellular domain-containing protein n=1 Tax=Schumannella luteola TaxID=472059 RepID=A0A852YLS4_9MICO|nr:hypothetical protein [Schumannella luteola]NYG98155.1 hypothetical protein [Schumannella luteola]TPX01872.1 hypothetical protein FJ656_26170 [Schumannella luteola]